MLPSQLHSQRCALMHRACPSRPLRQWKRSVAVLSRQRKNFQDEDGYLPEEETRDSWTSQRGAVGGPASFDTGRYFDRQRREYDEAPRRARRVDIDAPVQATERMERYGRERDEFSYLGDEEPYSVPSRSGAIVPRGRRDGYGDLTERDYGAWEGAPAAGGIAPMLDATINVVKSIWRATLGVLEANGLIEPRDVYSTPMLPGASSDPSRASRSLRAPQEWDVDRRSDLRSASGRSEETWGPGRDTGSPPATVRGFLAPPRDEIDSWDMPVERTRVRRGTTAPSPEWDGWLEEGGLGEDFPPKRRSPASSPGRARLGAADRENADSAVPFRVRGDGEDALAGSPDRMRRGTRASGREIGTELRPGAAKQGDASSRRMKAAANTTGAAAGKSGVRRRLRMEGDVGRMRDESARADAPDEEEDLLARRAKRAELRMKARKRWEARYLSLEEGAGAARDAWDESRGYEPGEERRARMRSKREGVAAAPMIDRGPRDSREEQRSRSAGEGTREAQARRDAAFRARVQELKQRTNTGRRTLAEEYEELDRRRALREAERYDVPPGPWDESPVDKDNGRGGYGRTRGYGGP